MTAAPTAPGNGELAQLDATDSPLSALSAAGFGFLRDMVSFLDEPLKQLAGDSGSVSSTAQGLRTTGDSLAALAATYRTSSATQTSRWSGDAADAYRTVGTQHADGIATLGQAASTVSGAVSAAGTTVAQTAQGIRQDITDAVREMLPIMTEAKARASATNGVSVAEAIPSCVRIAANYGRRIVARMRALLSNGQNLKELVDKTIRTVEAVRQALTGSGTQGGPTTGSGSTSSGSTGPQQSGAQQGTQAATPAGSTADTSNATSASDYLSPSGTSSGSDSAGSQGDGCHSRRCRRLVDLVDAVVDHDATVGGQRHAVQQPAGVQRFRRWPGIRHDPGRRAGDRHVRVGQRAGGLRLVRRFRGCRTGGGQQPRQRYVGERYPRGAHRSTDR